jgi:superoxide dismutase, Cu-Zn family
MRIALLALASLAVGLPALAKEAAATRHVELRNNAGASAGHAMITEAPKGVLLRIEAKGLPPGWHGLHFHETGDCSKPDFTSAGGHVHDTGSDRVHGLLHPDANEAGDLPNLYVHADGTANAEFFSRFVSLAGGGERPALTAGNGSALVIHANPDDHRTQPIGGAGDRIACGVIN